MHCKSSAQSKILGTAVHEPLSNLVRKIFSLLYQDFCCGGNVIMKYIYPSSDYRAITNIGYTLVAAGINVAVIVAIDGFSAILNTAFSSVNPLLESACGRFC